MCTKKQYPSKREADITLKDIRRNSGRSHIPKRVYFCKTCRCYHLTSRSTGQKIFSKLKITARKIKQLRNNN